MSRPSPALFTLLVSLLLFVVLANYGVSRRDRPYYDVVAYLDLSAGIAESGGPAALVKACLSGAYLEANRHPVYPALLSPLASRDGGFFIRAKLAGVLLGILLIVSVWFIAGEAAGPAAAALAAFLAATNVKFIAYSSTVAADLLFTIFVLWGWRFTGRWLDGELKSEIRNPKSEIKAAAPAGLLAGLAYLTKASGLLLVPAALPAAAVIFVKRTSGQGESNCYLSLSQKERKGVNPSFPRKRESSISTDSWTPAFAGVTSKIDLCKRLYSIAKSLRSGFFYLLPFLLVAAPLIVRNLTVYGSPFYNINQHVLWLDRWEDFFNFRRDGTLADLDLGWYLSRHPWYDPFLRMIEGAGGLFLGLSHTLIGFRPSGLALALYIPPAAALIALPVYAIAKDPRRGRRLYSVLFLAAFLLPLQWFCRVTCAERFFLPVTAVLEVYLAWGIVRLIKGRFGKKGRDPELLDRKLPRVMTVAAAVLAVIAIVVVGLPNPLRSFRIPAEEAALEAWMKENVKPADPWLQDNLSRFQPSWRLGLPGRFDYIPYDTPAGKVRSIVRETGAAYVLIDGEPPSGPLLSPPIVRGPEGVEGPKELFGWRLVYKGSGRFLVYGTGRRAGNER